MEEHEHETTEDPYATLAVAPAATAAEIRLAYLQKVREHPPERDPEGFKRVRAAYEVLRSPRKRAEMTLLELRHGPAEFDLDRLRDAPPPPFPDRFVDHLLAIVLSTVDAAIDAEVAQARDRTAIASAGSPDGAKGGGR